MDTNGNFVEDAKEILGKQIEKISDDREDGITSREMRKLEEVFDYALKCIEIVERLAKQEAIVEAIHNQVRGV